MKSKFKHILSGILSTATALSAIPIASAKAEESISSYPYTMFASSYNDGAITVDEDGILDGDEYYSGYVSQDLTPDENSKYPGDTAKEQNGDRFNANASAQIHRTNVEGRLAL